MVSFKNLANNTLIPEAHKIEGCKHFSLYQNIVHEKEFIFHEVWDNERSVRTYKQNLVAILGHPHSSEEFQAIMNDMIEADEDLV